MCIRDRAYAGIALSYVATMTKLIGMSLGWHDAVLYGHHATLFGMSPFRHVAVMPYFLKGAYAGMSLPYVAKLVGIILVQNCTVLCGTMPHLLA